ncbi:MAG: type 1 glutamine amidotransferase [Nodosilinea sp.]
MDILVVQNVEQDPIGILGEHLEAEGARLHPWLPLAQPELPLGRYDGLIILGGPMNACEDDKFPHLAQVVDLIHQFHSEDKPIMGICLGAQLIARAFGGQVYPHRVPELGFTAVAPVQNATPEPWLEEFPHGLHLMQWHFDTFDLPPGAELLMTNEVCQHQVYRIGSNIYGFQFHFEVTPAIVMAWMAFKTDWIEAHYPHLQQQLREQLVTYYPQSAQFAAGVAKSWLAQVALAAALA